MDGIYFVERLNIIMYLCIIVLISFTVRTKNTKSKNFSDTLEFLFIQSLLEEYKACLLYPLHVRHPIVAKLNVIPKVSQKNSRTTSYTKILLLGKIQRMHASFTIVSSHTGILHNVMPYPIFVLQLFIIFIVNQSMNHFEKRYTAMIHYCLNEFILLYRR